MNTIPTAQDCRDELEGYSIESYILSTPWIEKYRDNFVVPKVEKIIRQSLTASSIESYTEYISGNGKEIVYLSRRPIVSLTSIEYVNATSLNYMIDVTSVEVLSEEGALRTKAELENGIITPIFYKGNKNLKITYTSGYTNDTIPSELSEAIKYLICEGMLGQIGRRTGGGPLGVQGFSRNYGQRGKYDEIRQDLTRWAMSILSDYISPVVMT